MRDLRRQREAFLFVAALVFFAAFGCRRTGQVANEQVETFNDYAELPGLKAAHYAPLKTEYALLCAERATPAMLDSDAASEVNDAAVDLHAVLDEQFSSTAIDYAIERSGQMFEAEQLKWDSITMVQASQVGRQYEKQRLAIRQAIGTPGSHLSISLSQGVGLNIEFAEAALLYHRLETFHAANQMARGEVGNALETLRVMFQLQALVGAKKHVISRLTAAQCRRESLGIVNAIASNSATSSEQWLRLRQLIGDQLSDWPSDANAWIGDRAQGLHIYEMIRDGHLLSVFTSEELADLTKERTLDAFAAAAAKSIDADQAFYMQSMREVIDACKQPYHRRTAVFNTMRTRLGELQRTPEYPLIADRLLLQGIEQAHQRQALDRAWMEAWANGLALASEEGPPPYEINPLTGREYQIAFESGRVVVSRIDPTDIHAQVVIPLRRTERVSSGAPLPPPR